MYSNIPEELRLLPQWLVWRLEDIGARKPTKIPYDPKTGKLASVTDSSTWSDFDTAVNQSQNYSGIGFVFTELDPYTFIDLDDTEGDQLSLDRQLKIYHEFNSYSEISPSGRGLHVIVKGQVPVGRRRSFIEIYSSVRYATFTGNLYNKEPIKDCQDKLLSLWQQMGSGVQTLAYKGDDQQRFQDKEIVDQATNAVNGDKFVKLLKGQWPDIYPSQSEADLALIDMIAFYTQNRDQIERIFRASILGQRDKAKRKDYITGMINRSFDRMLPPLDFDGFKNRLEEKIAEQNQLKLPLTPATPAEFITTELPLDIVPKKPDIQLPPGLIGELAQFIYSAAPRPVPEIALAAAIGLMSGIAGRAYNVSGTGLNQYILLIANTGTGKEAMALGIDRLMNAVKFQVPTSAAFIGPSEIASGQALIKYIAKNPCFVSILGEFGYRLETMSHPHASSAEKTLIRILLDLFNKSGHGQNFRPSIYSDAEKNIGATPSPAFTILAESTPETFYGILNEKMIADGLLPRFNLIEYEGPRPKLNDNHQQATPSMMLIEKLSSLIACAETVMHGNRIINVDQTAEALAITKEFDKYADAQINSTSKEIVRQLWNRAHIKVLKLSALIAVGVNMMAPVILPEYVLWAMNLVQNDIRGLSEKFEQGLIGTNTFEIKQGIEIIRVIKDFILSDWEKVSKYIKEQHLHHARVIPYTYLNRRLVSLACFRLDKNGSTFAIKRAIQVLLDSDKVREIGKQELGVKYGTTQRAFMVSDAKILEG